MKWIVIFIVSLGASYLAISARSLLPKNIMRATVLQTLLYSAFGLITIAIILLTIISGLFVFGLLLQAYEAGAKVLNEDGDRRLPPE